MLATTLGAPASAAFGLLGRIAQAAHPLLSPPATPAGNVSGMMTPGRIRAVLLEMEVAAADLDIALASALAQAGLPLTVASLAEAHGELARAPGASPQAYALAKMLALPTSPDALRALTAVLNAPDDRSASHAMPEAVRTWLGLGVEAGDAAGGTGAAFAGVGPSNRAQYREPAPVGGAGRGGNSAGGRSADGAAAPRSVVGRPRSAFGSRRHGVSRGRTAALESGRIDRAKHIIRRRRCILPSR